MRIVEKRGSLKGWIRDLERLATEGVQEIESEFEKEFRMAQAQAQLDVHIHTGNLKTTLQGEGVSTPGQFRGQLYTNNADAARAAHWEREKGGDHDFTRSLNDGTHFGAELEAKLDHVLGKYLE